MLPLDLLSLQHEVFGEFVLAGRMEVLGCCTEVANSLGHLTFRWLPAADSRLVVLDLGPALLTLGMKSLQFGFVIGNPLIEFLNLSLGRPLSLLLTPLSP